MGFALVVIIGSTVVVVVCVLVRWNLDFSCTCLSLFWLVCQPFYSGPAVCQDQEISRSDWFWSISVVTMVFRLDSGLTSKSRKRNRFVGYMSVAEPVGIVSLYAGMNVDVSVGKTSIR